MILGTMKRINVDIMIIYISAMEVKIQQLCSSAIYKQNVSILLRLSDSVHSHRPVPKLA